MRRLDYVFSRVGRAAIELKLPRALTRFQQAVHETRRQLAELERTLNKAEVEHRQAPDPTEGMRRTSLLARVRSECDKQKRLAEFAVLVLGRECLQANFVPDGCSELREEVEELRRAASA